MEGGKHQPYAEATVSLQRYPLPPPSQSRPASRGTHLIPFPASAHPPLPAVLGRGGRTAHPLTPTSPSPDRGGGGGSITGAGEGHTDHRPPLSYREAGAEGGPPDRSPGAGPAPLPLYNAAP